MTRAGRKATHPSASALAAEAAARIAALPDPTVPALRAVRREFSARLRDEPARLVIGLALQLAASGGIGRRFVGYELLRRHPGAPLAITAAEVERLGRGMDSWGAVDCFGVYVSGPAWRRGRLADSRVLAWARSADRWWRRAALVSTVPLNSAAHGGAGDIRRTLRLCRRLAKDRDPMVVKALSWALRELAKREPAAVRAYLEGAGTLAAQVRREVRNKLETGRKNPRRR
jgi:3-methyladenine DNA glycosylase AlkD